MVHVNNELGFVLGLLLLLLLLTLLFLGGGGKWGGGPVITKSVNQRCEFVTAYQYGIYASLNSFMKSSAPLPAYVFRMFHSVNRTGGPSSPEFQIASVDTTQVINTRKEWFKYQSTLLLFCHPPMVLSLMTWWTISNRLLEVVAETTCRILTKTFTLLECFVRSFLRFWHDGEKAWDLWTNSN